MPKNKKKPECPKDLPDPFFPGNELIGPSINVLVKTHPMASRTIAKAKKAGYECPFRNIPVYPITGTVICLLPKTKDVSYAHPKQFCSRCITTSTLFIQGSYDKYIRDIEKYVK